MKKQELIEKLLNEKAKENNTIDLNAFASGLDAMYEALNLADVSNNEVAVNCGNCQYAKYNRYHSPCVDCNEDFNRHVAIK